MLGDLQNAVSLKTITRLLLTGYISELVQTPVKESMGKQLANSVASLAKTRLSEKALEH